MNLPRHSTVFQLRPPSVLFLTPPPLPAQTMRLSAGSTASAVTHPSARRQPGVPVAWPPLITGGGGSNPRFQPRQLRPPFTVL